MAYSNRYNPDALPPHAEPEQAAALRSSGAPKSHPSAPSRSDSRGYRSNPPPPSASSSRYDDRQPPPLRDDRYGIRSPSASHEGRDRRDDRDRPRPGSYGHHSRADSRQYSSSTSSRHGNEPLMSPGTAGRTGFGSPPPQNYGYGSLGPPPARASHGRPPAAAPPATPTQPKDANDRDALWPLFKAVDKDRSGQLSEDELKAALVNGDWSRFDEHTVKMMIRMFDTDRSGTINFDEFCGLWGFLAAWRTLFDRFDTDRSGNISYNEFSEALVAFGYRLSPSFVSLLYRTYDRRGDNAMSFDLFVQACISLKRMTDVFKKYDDDRDGYITLSL